MTTMPTLILIGADKGGVGKTTVARAFLDYLKERGVRPSVFDTEPPPGVLRRFYDYSKPVDVSQVRGQMQVFDEAPGAGVTVVDIRAGGLSKVLTAMRDAGLLKDIHAGKMHMVVIHVLGSTEASTGYFKSAGAKITLEVPHLDGMACDSVEKRGGNRLPRSSMMKRIHRGSAASSGTGEGWFGRNLIARS